MDLIKDLFLPVATLIVAAWAVHVYRQQLKAMQAQLIEARNSSSSQNLLSLIDYIQRPEHRKARHVLFTLESKPLATWTDDERKEAEIACSAWDAIGLILKNTSIPNATELISKNWQHSIFQSFKVANELLTALRNERDPAFWDDFEWLYNQLDADFSANQKILHLDTTSISE